MENKLAEILVESKKDSPALPTKSGNLLIRDAGAFLSHREYLPACISQRRQGRPRFSSATNVVMAAYNVKEYQVSGGPAWVARIDSLWDIAAKTPGDGQAGIDQVRIMLQDLLTERFRLKLRRETKQLPVYNLFVAKGGPKLKSASETPPVVRGMRRGSMDQLAALLSVMIGRPVIDKTGLPGAYDYSNELAVLDHGAQDSADTISRTLTAIHNQLGLKAEASKAMIEMLTIQGAEEPTEN